MKQPDTNIRGTESLLRRAGDLARLMDQLAALNEQLLMLATRKLEAIRAADLGAMSACNDEQELVCKRLTEREGLRKQLMDAIGAELGLAVRTGRRLTISQLLPKLPHAACAQVSAARDSLRDIVGKLAQANRVSGAVSRELIHHLEFVFSAVRPSVAATGQYSASGTLRPAASRVFETVG
jgi:hypothetical protein